MKLTIVIPAYNEEAAIAKIIERTLAARPYIAASSPVDEVEVIVVSDGSTDATARIARGYDQIKLIEFPANRGYGAAIKRGFAEGDGELCGFLDADGTCDPRFFADLCTALVAEEAAVALGSRMGPRSQMPRLRRIGNRVYAGILSVLTNRVVHDTASGMRVIRREALPRLYPLPDGLNFTPAMSARALLDERLPVVEVPMDYAERIGASKLNVLRDGWRFFQTIMEMTLFRRPARVLLSGAILCALTTLLLAAYPVEMWVTTGRLEEPMIYRLLFCSFLGSVGVLLMSALVISETLRGLEPDARGPATLLRRMIEGFVSARALAGLTLVLGPVVAWLIGPGVWTWITERHVEIHWSRVVLAGLLAFAWSQLLVTKIIVQIIRLHVARRGLAERTPRRQADIARAGAARNQSSASVAGEPAPV
jgi:glycosyltransferase involved in cell wall biosynthesis